MEREIPQQKVKRRMHKMVMNIWTWWKWSAGATVFLFLLFFLDVVAIGRGYFTSDFAMTQTTFNILCATSVTLFAFSMNLVCKFFYYSRKAEAIARKYT